MSILFLSVCFLYFVFFSLSDSSFIPFCRSFFWSTTLRMWHIYPHETLNFFLKMLKFIIRIFLASETSCGLYHCHLGHWLIFSFRRLINHENWRYWRKTDSLYLQFFALTHSGKHMHNLLTFSILHFLFESFVCSYNQQLFPMPLAYVTI